MVNSYYFFLFSFIWHIYQEKNFSVSYFNGIRLIYHKKQKKDISHISEKCLFDLNRENMIICNHLLHYGNECRKKQRYYKMGIVGKLNRKKSLTMNMKH